MDDPAATTRYLQTTLRHLDETLAKLRGSRIHRNEPRREIFLGKLVPACSGLSSRFRSGSRRTTPQEGNRGSLARLTRSIQARCDRHSSCYPRRSRRTRPRRWSATKLMTSNSSPCQRDTRSPTGQRARRDANEPRSFPCWSISRYRYGMEMAFAITTVEPFSGCNGFAESGESNVHLRAETSKSAGAGNRLDRAGRAAPAERLGRSSPDGIPPRPSTR